jgi:hypothetical protein
MANLYELLMARERGNIQDAPNKQRIGQAPLNLRSAMRYAEGGSTEGPAAAIARIQAMLDENKRNSAAQIAAAQAQSKPDTYKEDNGRTAENPRDNLAKTAENLRDNFKIPPRPIDERINPVDPGIDMDAIRRAQELAEMEKRRQEEEYYFKMRNLEPPSLPPQTGLDDTDPGFTPMPIAPAYPPNYFDPKPVEQPTNVGYPIGPLPENYPGAPVQTYPQSPSVPENYPGPPSNPQPPSSGLLGQLGTMFQPTGLGQSMQGTGLGASLGAGFPGQTMQGQSKPVAGMGQSLDSLINYLSTPRKP